MRGLWFAAILLPLLIDAGCNRGLPVAPASGTVTLDGKPLAGATVTTQPIASGDSRNPGSGSFGHTDEQGHFELEIVEPAQKGAIIGTHRVMISPPAGSKSREQPKQSADGSHLIWSDDQKSNRIYAGLKWPKAFNDGSLTIEVPLSGTDSLRFDLKR